MRKVLSQERGRRKSPRSARMRIRVGSHLSRRGDERGLCTCSVNEDIYHLSMSTRLDFSFVNKNSLPKPQPPRVPQAGAGGSLRFWNRAAPALVADADRRHDGGWLGRAEHSAGWRLSWASRARCGPCRGLPALPHARRPWAWCRILPPWVCGTESK